MKDRSSLLFGLLVGVAFSFVFFAGYWIVDSSNDSAYLSCILSAEDGYTTALSLVESKGLITLNEDWRDLTREEMGIVNRQFDGGPKFDCARFDYVNDGQNERSQLIGLRGRKVGKSVEVRLTNLGEVCRYQ